MGILGLPNLLALFEQGQGMANGRVDLLAGERSLVAGLRERGREV